MAKQTRTTLKGYFETGDIPTGGNYVDLIDSPLMLNTENTGSANILGTITASGDISSSGTGSFTGGIVSTNATGSFGRVQSTTLTGTLKTATQTNITSVGTLSSLSVGNITSSGTISASGFISAFGSSSFVGLPTTEPSTTGTLWLSGSGGGSASGSKYLMVFTG
tara:strand:+ start:828 stop:1322 length:495 start_codon:yes stop_codon:yes gene_type:complete